MAKNNLKIIRLEKGWSQTKLSAKTEIAQSDLSAIENDRVEPHPGWVKRICKALGKSKQEIFPNAS